MARVAQLFELVIGGREVAYLGGFERGQILTVRRDVVDESENAVRHQHAMGLGEESSRLREMMRGEPAGHEIEAHVGKGEVFGLGARGADIAEPALGSELLGLGKHLIGDVARRDLGDARCEGERGVAGAGRDVEHAP